MSERTELLPEDIISKWSVMPSVTRFSPVPGRPAETRMTDRPKRRYRSHDRGVEPPPQEDVVLALELLARIPDDWDEVYIRPEYFYEGKDKPARYTWMKVTLVRGDRFTNALITPTLLRHMSDELLERFVTTARREIALSRSAPVDPSLVMTDRLAEIKERLMRVRDEARRRYLAILMASAPSGLAWLISEVERLRARDG